jgi:hypothetical protein
VGNVVMKASRSEAARAAARADESNLPHARLQGQAPGGRWERPSCGEGDAAGATWRGRRRRGPASFTNPSLHARERASAIFENRAKYSSPLFEIGEVTLKEDSGIIQGCLCVNRSAVTHHRN